MEPVRVVGFAAETGSELPYRVPPHNLEAEQALLGALLVNNAVYGRVSEFLVPEHFADPLHGRIFEAIAKLVERGQIASPITLKSFFESEGSLEELGAASGQNTSGAAYLARLAASVVTVINAHDYGRTIYDAYLRRELVAIGSDVVNDAYDHDIDIDAKAQIEMAEKKLFDLATSGVAEGGFQPFVTALKNATLMAEQAYKRNGKTSGVSSGFIDLDKLLGGLHPSDLVILAGRPSMGKAQPLDANVLTLHGWKKMGDLRVGDPLASVDGRPSHVSAIFPQGMKQIWRISFADGRSTECCDEHLWRVYRRDWSVPRILSTSAVARLLKSKRNEGRLWIDLFDGDFGHDAELPIDPWLLGALLGDGTLSGSSVRLSTAETELRDRAAVAAGASFALRHAGGYDWRFVTAAGRTRIGLQGVVPNALAQNLKSLGLWDITSDRKFIPTLYKTARREVRLAVLNGLLDTDGWVESWGSIRFCSTSRVLAEDVAELARSLGATTSLNSKETTYTYRGEKRCGRLAYVCNIQHPKPGTLFRSSLKLTRVARGRGRQRRLTISSIEPTRHAHAQCIAVSHPEHLYITDGFIVTHNTALVTNIAFNVAKAYRPATGPNGEITAEDGGIVGFFSLEMSAEQLATRILSEESGVSGDKIRKGEVSHDEFDKFILASMTLQSVPLFIDDTPALTIAALRTRARRLKRQRGLHLIVVDYLQLLQGVPSRGGEINRVQEISEITRGLKALAKELDVPVIALSQLSRAVEQREDKRPQLSDLRESGSIEQDADVVMFVFREEYYLGRAEPMRRPEENEEKYNQRYADWHTRLGQVHGLGEVIVAKQRHGPIGKVTLRFEGATTKFADYADAGRLPDADY